MHQTKDFEVIPREEVKSGKRFIVNQEKKTVTLRAESDCSPLGKQFKVTNFRGIRSACSGEKDF